MEIINIPITDYLKLCLNTAEQRGFLWVMVLLARERDIPDGYQDIIQYWNSYNDLTGDRILFLLTMSNNPHVHYQQWLRPEDVDYSYIRVGNNNLMVINNTPPSLTRWDYGRISQHSSIHREAVNNTSLHISALLAEYDLSESDIPAILLFPTTVGEKTSPIVIREVQDIYRSIKNFICFLEPSLQKYDKLKSQLNKLRLEEIEIEHEISQCKLDKQVRRYLQAESYIKQAAKEMNPTDCDALKSAIEKEDYRACSIYSQPLRGFINRLLDIQKQNPEIKWHIRGEQQKAERYQYLHEKKDRIEVEIAVKGADLSLVRQELQFLAYEYANNNMRRGGKNLTSSSKPHFKIAFTFSGKYRDKIILPVCDQLLKQGFSKDDIFYDEWHSALINGIDGSDKLQSIYYKQSDCVVVLLSPDYHERNWTGNIEWRAVKELINTGSGGKICLLAVDNVDIEEIDGIFIHQAIFTPVDEMTPEEIATFVNQKYLLL